MKITRRFFLVGLLASGLAFALPQPAFTATLEEIYDVAFGDLDTSPLRKKVAIAAIIKAEAILGEATPSQTRLDWALSALQDPIGASLSLFRYVLAANDSATQSQILNASDNTVQTNVNAAVDALYP